MKRWMQGLLIVLGSIMVTSLVLAAALAWGPHHCEAKFPKVIGCAMGSYESLAGGLIAAAAALIAGWIAWTAVQVQIESEEKRALSDRAEVEELLESEIDDYAEVVASIWKILDEPDFQENGDLTTDSTQAKLGAVKNGIEWITNPSRISSSRTMVAILGWKRRRRYEELFDGLDRLGQFGNTVDFDVYDVQSTLKQPGSIAK
jgi:hypothetical protein